MGIRLMSLRHLVRIDRRGTPHSSKKVFDCGRISPAARDFDRDARTGFHWRAGDADGYSRVRSRCRYARARRSELALGAHPSAVVNACGFSELTGLLSNNAVRI